MSRVAHFWQAFVSHFLHEILLHSLRGTLLAGGMVLLVSSTGAWKYMGNSMQANDLRRAAAYSKDSISPSVLMVAIDDTGFDQFYGGRSPLDRKQLQRMLEVVERNAPNARGIVIDLDLSPVPGDTQEALFGFFATKPQRWVLAEPVRKRSDDTDVRRHWRERLCAAGVRMALPYLPTEFGYVVSTQQYRGSLVDVALHPDAGCARLPDLEQGDANPVLKRSTALMAPDYVNHGLVVPFQGDLDLLAQTVAGIDPQWVVIGGTWGVTDLLNTPMGERYGAQLHAAALQGHVQGERQASFLFQITVAWIVVALIALQIGAVQGWMKRAVDPWMESFTGHRFFKLRLWPLLLVLFVVLQVGLVSELLAVLRAHTHFWIPSAEMAVLVIGTMAFVWNWGLTDIGGHHTVSHVWHHGFLQPVKDDWASLRTAWTSLSGRSATNCTDADGNPLPVSRVRAVAEITLATASLCGQTVLPTAVLVYELLAH
ncbi:CHASE2 domain-containing protein [Curvibacter sp. APW13]|uniref:CHASE2 domain-containing protein n=1 Tax=Curvibacter sp. APW13 TaxID=3077236 RepID=UPI0028DD8737|nr:CHASE2 domain-containing protein [Curvibacter sp. APW13]MDT8991520.1 CHASE2 domain-containing protein [Curvibacter sp. APW13]